MSRKVCSFIAAGTLAAFAFAPVAAEPGSDIRSLPISLTETHIPKSGFAEPSIALSAKDHVFFCGPLGIPGGQIGFVRSADWQTFTRQTILDRGGGGDCDVRVGADGAVYTANLQAFGSAIRKSVDDGQTFTYQTSEDAVEQDRQWLATDPVDPSIVYLGYHDWSIGAIVVAKLLDGGATFVVHSMVSNDPVLIAKSGKFTFPGPVRIDPTNHLRLYMVWSQASVEDCAADPVLCSFTHRTLVVGRSDDGGLTWRNRVVAEMPYGSVLSWLIPWLTIDRAGNV